MSKRLWGVMLVFCLMVSVLPVKALAEGEQEQVLPSACQEGCALAAGHEGDCVLHETRYQTEADGEWHYGTLAEACDGVYAGGTVEVLRDIRLENAVAVARPLLLTSADPANPCTITYAAKSRGDYLLTVSADTVLADIILDGGREEGLTAQAELVGLRRGQLVMAAGAVMQNNDNINTSKGAGGLRVISGEAVMQQDSLIRSCRAVAGGGAAVSGDDALLVLNGGAIEDCQAFVGGGVFIQEKGAVKLYDGSSVCGNQAKKELPGMSYGFSPRPGCGGGICVESGYVYMLGGADGATLADNFAESSGGGIYVNAGVVQLANGSVRDNHAVSFGGGITASPSANILVGNGPAVVGNTSDEHYFYDLYLDGVEDEYPPYGTRPMMIGAALWDKASIGVARWTRPDKEHPYRIVAVPANGHIIDESDLSKFFSDDPAYIVLLHEGNIVLTHAEVVFDNQGHGVTPHGQQFGDDRKVTDPGELTEKGYVFGGWYQEPECETVWDFDNDTIVEDRVEPLTLYAKWNLIPYAINYVLDGGINAAANPGGYTVESDTIILQEPTKEGCTFEGWTWPGEDTPQTEVTIPAGSVEDREYTAHWTATVSFDVQGRGTAPASQSVSCGSHVAQPDDPAAEGYTFGGWYKEAACREKWDFANDTVSANMVLYAKWTKRGSSHSGSSRPKPQPEEEKQPYVPSALESEEHFAYIVGYPDGNVRPESNISRAEVAAIFFRLMTDDFRAENAAVTNPFPDVNLGNWYNNAVSTAARAGLILGLPDGTFGGEQPITRAEFAAIAARFLSDETAPGSGFTDMTGHWAEDEVNRAVAAGWIKGFPDGGFHPGEYITRAEVVTMVNRMLGRVPQTTGMHEDMTVWPDNLPSAWYYADLQEATNGHTYARDEASGPETWTGLLANRDWTELER